VVAKAGKERVADGVVLELNVGVAVLAVVAGRDLAAERPRDLLEAIADAQDRHADLVKEAGLDVGRVGVVDRRRAARQDDA